MDKVTEFFEGLFANRMVGVLVIFMIADIATGWMVAFIKQKLSSTIGMIGMTRKACILLLVSVTFVLEPYAEGMPLTKLVAMFFIAVELISILENSTILGVPIPPVLKGALHRLKGPSEDEMEIPAHTVRVKRKSDFIELTKPEQKEGK